jgi:hypothetical protein
MLHARKAALRRLPAHPDSCDESRYETLPVRFIGLEHAL